MRSLTNEIHVGNYLARHRKNGFLIRGFTSVARERKFTLTRISTGKWSLSGTVSNGKRERLRKRFEALGLEEAVEEAERLLYGPTAIKSNQQDLLISDCFSKWHGSLSVGEDARDNYSRLIGYFLDWCEAQGLRHWNQLRLEHIEKYANSLVEAKKKPRTIKLYTQPVRTTSRWASLNWPELYKDFAQGFKLPKPPSEFLIEDPHQRATISLREVGKLLVWLRTSIAGWRILPGVALQGLCGIRVREAYRLRWEKVDLENGTVTVEGQVKNSHSVRRLPLPKLVWEILREARTQSPYVICGFKNSQNYAEAISDAIKAWRPGIRLEPKGL